jgi:hypothetical protein
MVFIAAWAFWIGGGFLGAAGSGRSTGNEIAMS